MTRLVSAPVCIKPPLGIRRDELATTVVDTPDDFGDNITVESFKNPLVFMSTDFAPFSLLFFLVFLFVFDFEFVVVGNLSTESSPFPAENDENPPGFNVDDSILGLLDGEFCCCC